MRALLIGILLIGITLLCGCSFSMKAHVEKLDQGFDVMITYEDSR